MKAIKKHLLFLECLIITFVVGACATSDKIEVQEFANDNKTKVLTYNSNMRSIFISNSKEALKYCSEPTPDSGESSKSGVSLGVTALKGSEEEVGSTQGENSYALGGRNGTVLITREVLFRICEMGVNYKATYEQQATLFLKALETIEKIANDKQALNSTRARKIRATKAPTIKLFPKPEPSKTVTAPVRTLSSEVENDSSNSSDD